MNRLIAALLLVNVTIFTPISGMAAPSPEEAALSGVLSTDPVIAAAGIDALRSRGPAGLRLLLDAHASEIERVRTGGVRPSNWERVRTAIDHVAGQRDAYASGLFWYTDLESAKAAAVASGRPILSLRLLGRLDEELSCANSRFFRTALYANADVSRFLSEHFVLHWSSERPAPKITIDFGDGRTLVRTITGNSIHYVLDERGRPVDALPGLYGPRAFVRELALVEPQAIAVAKLDADARAVRQREYLSRRLDATRSELALRTAAAREPAPVAKATPKPVRPARATAAPKSPTAAAGRLAMTKSIVEIVPLRLMDLESDAARRPGEDAVWEMIGTSTLADAKLDAGSLRLMRSQLSQVTTDDAAFERIVERFERSIAVDTARNEYALRLQIDERLLDATVDDDLESLNRWVYDTVFLTPKSDPWLGLNEPDVYTALENGGVVLP